MATTIAFRNLTTYPRAIPQNGYKDMLVANPTATGVNLWTDSSTPLERPLLISGVPMRFWSERVATEVTISGSVTFSIQRGLTDAGFTGRFRAYLSKITVGGSNIESPIGQADATLAVLGEDVHIFSFTPAASVTIAPNERFICRVTVMPIAGSFGTGAASINYNNGSGGGNSNCTITFTETFTFRANGTKFYLQPTGSGIGNFYVMTETLDGGVATDAVVNTTAGGTEIQWTRTAGGTVLEWISPRVKAPGWTADTINLFGTVNADAPQAGAMESNIAANATLRFKMFRRKSDGTELLVGTWTYTLLEFGTTITNTIMRTTAATATLAQVTNFFEDDRFVLRAYCIPFTALTMGGSRTCTLRYNLQTPGAGHAFFMLLDGPEFKASGDPDASASTVPSGLMMGGVGN